MVSAPGTGAPLKDQRLLMIATPKQVHAIVVTRRIVLDQFSVLFVCIDVMFFSLCYCLHVCLCGVLFLAMCS